MNHYNEYRQTNIPNKLIHCYQDYNLSDKELINIISMLSFNKELIELSQMNKVTKISRNTLSKFVDINFVTLVEKNNNIYIDISPMFKELYNGSTIDKEQKPLLDSKQLDRFNLLLNRNLKAFEVEKITQWINEGYDAKEIELAMQKSVINNVDNMNYIYAVLSNKEREVNNSEQGVVKKNFDIF